MSTICTTLPTSHEKPKNVIELYDNLTLTLSYVKGFFEAIALAAEEDPPGIANVADLGVILTDEASARAKALYEFMKARIAETEER